MIAKRLNTPIRNYAPHYILDRDASLKDKTNLLARIKITDIYFLYEPEHFSHYWEIFVKNGSNIRTVLAQDEHHHHHHHLPRSNYVI